MRKLLSIILAAALVLSMSTAAFATVIDNDTEIKTGFSEMVYYLESGYCIEIPEQIDATAPYTFSAIYINLSETEQVVVRMSGVNEVSQVELHNDAGDALTFGVTYDYGVISPDNVVAVFTDSVTANGAMTLSPDLLYSAHRVGQYSGIFEFTISVEDRA